MRISKTALTQLRRDMNKRLDKPGSKRSRLPRQMRLAEACAKSDMTIDTFPPNTVAIHLHGWLKAVPSLKNSRPVGTNFMSVHARDFISVMDIKFRALLPRGFIPTDDSKYFLVVCFADRAHRFDPDNATTTIKDWLEPSWKIVGRQNKRERGWGAGLVKDDNQIIAFGFRASDFGFKGECTTIFLSRVEEENDARLTQLEQLISCALVHSKHNTATQEAK
jgi:hypothetical protein